MGKLVWATHIERYLMIKAHCCRSVSRIDPHFDWSNNDECLCFCAGKHGYGKFEVTPPPQQDYDDRRQYGGDQGGYGPRKQVKVWIASRSLVMKPNFLHALLSS